MTAFLGSDTGHAVSPFPYKKSSKRKASSSSCVEGACSLTGHLVFLQDFTVFEDWLDIAQTIGQNERGSCM